MNYKQAEESAERLRELSSLAARLRSQRSAEPPPEPLKKAPLTNPTMKDTSQPSVEQPTQPVSASRTMEDLILENELLRKKYNKALLLLSQYRRLLGVETPSAPADQAPPDTPPPPGSRRNLLKRYMEVHSLKSGEEDMFGLAESMNSGGFGKPTTDEPDRVEEISSLLKSLQRPVLPIGKRGAAFS